MMGNQLRTPSIFPAYNANRARLETMIRGVEGILDNLNSLGTPTVSTVLVMGRLADLLNRVESSEPGQISYAPPMMLPEGWTPCTPKYLRDMSPVQCENIPRIPGVGNVSHYHPWMPDQRANNAKLCMDGFYRPFSPHHDLTPEQVEANSRVTTWISYVTPKQPEGEQS